MQLMAEILHQLRLVVYPIILKVWYIPGWLFGISSINLVPVNVDMHFLNRMEQWSPAHQEMNLEGTGELCLGLQSWRKKSVEGWCLMPYMSFTTITCSQR